MRPSDSHKNLVVVRAGAGGLHPGWLAPKASRNFDVLIAAYDPQAMGRDCESVRHIFIEGYKVAGWSAVFRRLPDLLSKYDQIALLDEDLEANAQRIGRCFDLGRSYDLQIWQPSLSWDSYATYAATLHNPAFRLRYVNYIEMMCPFFRSEILKECLPLFDLGLESGIDLIWCSLSPADKRRHAIIDDVQFRHTRPVGSQKQRNGFADRTYEDDINRCLALFGFEWPSCVADLAETRTGAQLSGARKIGFRTAHLYRSLQATPPGNRRYRLMTVLDHTRHQLVRAPHYLADASAKLHQIAKSDAVRLKRVPEKWEPVFG